MESALAIIEQGDGALVPEWTPSDIIEAIREQPGALFDDCFPLQHQFAPGVYLREITMPGDTIVVGKIHKTRHFNIISRGVVSFWVEGHAVKTVTAPYTFISEPGAQKVLYVHEETVWSTVHPTDETDLTKLEALLIESDDLRLEAPTGEGSE